MKAILSACALSVLSLQAVVLADDSRATARTAGGYEVTVTNASTLSFTPLLIVAHRGDVALFEAGDEPSAALAELAESGGTAGLTAILDTLPDLVGDYETTAGLLEPGQSVTVQLEASRRFDRISIGAMLLPTNDSFVGLQSAVAPSKPGVIQRYTAVAYDAGSEPNDELCANIPGPPCFGSGGSPDEGGEGYVRVSPGIQGVGDVIAANYDWRNPVAIVTVERIKIR